jgi:hypothetical protein
MTLSKISSHPMTMLLVASAIHLSVAAAELEGTLVPLGDSGTEAAQPSAVTEAPQPIQHLDVTPPQEPLAPPPDLAPAAPSPDHHLHWQRDLDKGLAEAFGKQNVNERTFNMALLIPILGVIFIFGGPIVLLCYFLSQHYRAKAQRQQAINVNIDKLLAAGRDIPIELLRGDDPVTGSESGDLAKGVRLFFLGIGLLIFLTAFLGFSIGSVGFIPLALGCSRMLIWYINKPKATDVHYPQAGQQD